eukprot:s2358_g3.t1
MELFEAIAPALGNETTSSEWTMAFAAAQLPVLFFVLVTTGGLAMIQKLPKWLWRCCRCLCCNQKTRKEVDSKLTDLQNQYRMQIAKSAAAVGLLLSAAYRFYQVAGDTFMERIQRDVVLVTWEVMLLTVTVLIASGRMTCWRFMNLAYFLLMLLLSVSLLPGMIGGRHLVMAISMTWLLRCSIVPLTNSVRLVVFSNLVCHLCMRVATEWTRDRNTPELRTPRGPRADFYVRFVDNSLAIDTALSLLSCLISAWLEHTTCSIVEKSLETAMLKNEAKACESLLATFCDAHLFLDSELRLVKDMPNLASMLFRASNNAGTDFMQCLATQEDRDFQKRLEKCIAKGGEEAEDLEKAVSASHFRMELQMKLRNGGVTKSKWKFYVQQQHEQIIVQGVLIKTVGRLRSPRTSGRIGAAKPKSVHSADIQSKEYSRPGSSYVVSREFPPRPGSSMGSGRLGTAARKPTRPIDILEEEGEAPDVSSMGRSLAM